MSHEVTSDFYRKQEQGYNGYKNSSCFLEKNTTNNWRHERFYKPLLPIFNFYKSDAWLTVGDGRYGSDTQRLNAYGVKNVLTTDISDTLLKIAKKEGAIKEYAKENAEHLSFGDDEFDFSLCKESFHHFPRPWVAVYEMLRVSRKGVVFIEPLDQFDGWSMVEWFFFRLKIFLKKNILKRADIMHRYEEGGNYVYNFSTKEFEKLAVALNFSMVCFCKINDQYILGVEDENVKENGPLFKKIRKNILINDVLCRLKIKKHGVVLSILFKDLPQRSLTNLLIKNGFIIKELPRNPHIS